jgi:hypothetical protein
MEIYIECPHCGDMVQILQINCGIFRHGVFKESYQQINPHAPQEYCKLIFENGLIYGCGKPFKLVTENGQYKAIICDYI